MTAVQSSERFARREFWAFVAADTFEPIVERIKALVQTDRRMVLLQRYSHTPENLAVKVGLRLDPDVRGWDGTTENGIHTGEHSFHVHLTPGIEGFGFSVTNHPERVFHHRHAALRRDARPISSEPLTRVHVDGWPHAPSRDDRIDVEHWNEHGVCILTSLVFQADWG